MQIHRTRMTQDQFLLKWNNHQNNFVEVFNFLRTQDSFIDVTLACDGKSFSAHKVVLSACSPYFQTLFQTNPCKHPIVFLKDVKGQDMEALIEFIYRGEVSVSQTELGSLISTAENLKIKGLAEPDRPIEKAVKHHLSSPTRGQNQQQIHAPMSLFQSSPSPKRKRCDQYFNNKEDKISLNSLSEAHIHSQQSQVVLLPQDSSTATDLSPQPYSHGSTISTSDGVLYSVAGAAIYVGSTPTNSNNREIVREVFQDPITNDGEDTVPGPSGVQYAQTSNSPMSIKIEPPVPVNAEGWDGSNHSYDDAGGTGSDGGNGTPSSSLGNPGDLSLTLPLHSDLDSSQLHDSSRGTCVATVVRCHDMSTYGSSSSNVTLNESNSSDSGTVTVKTEGGTSRRLLECEHCHKQFTSRFNLQRHQLIHTGAKPYECPLCHQRFNQSGHVKTHLRTRHPSHVSEMIPTCDANSI